MSTQCKVDARGGDKTLPLVRRNSSALSRRPGPASHNPMPAGRVQNEFTVEEHLLVQRQIEERARRIWSANGFASQNPLDHWLMAEDEVLTEFVKNLMSRNPGNSVPGKPQNNKVALTLPPEISHPQPKWLKQNSNTTIQ